MAAERVVIVGAGPAGLSTARSYREHGGEGSVTLVGEEPLLPYQRPPLTKGFLRGQLDASQLAIEGRRWFDEHDVQLQIARRVDAVDPRAGSVRVEDATLPADAIVLATGAEPQRPPLPGIEHPAVMTLRTLPDSVRIAQQTDADTPVLVLGTGFIGCEIAASLAMRGAAVTLLGREPLPQAARLGENAARRIAEWLRELDVRVLGEASVRAVHDGRALELQDGSCVRGACVVLGMGVSPRVQLAERAGLQVRDGAICADSSMRARRLASEAGAASVFAVGDVAWAHNERAGRALRVEHWGDALEHGKVAGRALAGEDARWEGVPGFWSTIGEHTLKYAAWGDGFDEVHVERHRDDAFTAWYGNEGTIVGVLAHEADEDYDRGRELIKAGTRWPY